MDKPIIQFAVEEGIEAGITTLVFVTGGTKRAIEDHFDANSELEAALAKAGKDQMLEMGRTILPTGISCLFVRQPVRNLTNTKIKIMKINESELIL